VALYVLPEREMKQHIYSPGDRQALQYIVQLEKVMEGFERLLYFPTK
jgi:hypothetical protein